MDALKNIHIFKKDENHNLEKEEIPDGFESKLDPGLLPYHTVKLYDKNQKLAGYLKFGLKIIPNKSSDDNLYENL